MDYFTCNENKPVEKEDFSQSKLEDRNEKRIISDVANTPSVIEDEINENLQNHTGNSLCSNDNSHDLKMENCENALAAAEKESSLIIDKKRDNVVYTEQEIFSEEKGSRTLRKGKKFSLLIDSDSDSDINLKLTESGQYSSVQFENNSEANKGSDAGVILNEERNLFQKKQSKRIKANRFSLLIDSDSESNNETGAAQKGDGENVAVAKQSEGDNFNKVDIDKIASIEPVNIDQRQRDGKNIDTIANEKGEGKSKKVKKSNKISTLIDSDSESDTEGDRNKYNDCVIPNRRGKNVQQINATQTISTKDPIKDIKEIKSETQRLSREDVVSIPYHKPKQYTLKEFMTRKTISKPQITKKGISKGKTPKMGGEELEKFAQYLEERAKEAKEFFKSESENESQEDSNEHVNSDVQSQGMDTKIQEISIDIVEGNIERETQESVEIPETPASESQSINLMVENSMENSQEEVNVHICTDAKPTLNVENLKKLLMEDELPASPSLKGEPNMLIDLETGDLIPSKLTGVDKLLEKFLKTSVKKHNKPPNKSSMFSIETGEIELPSTNAELLEETVNTKYKPGSSYFKLKNGLKSLISKKRKEELIKKKQENELEAKANEMSATEDEEKEDELDEEFHREVEESEHEEIDELNAEIIETQEDEDEVLDATDADDELDSDNEEDEENCHKRTFKHRIISAFGDSEEDLIQFEKDNSLEEKRTSSLWEKDFGDSNPEKELLELCSGKFTSSQPCPVLSQIPTRQLEDNINETELLELCSGTFSIDNIPERSKIENFEIEIPLTFNKNIPLETSEEEETIKKQEEIVSKRCRRKRLGFSDDEEEQEEYEDSDRSDKNDRDNNNDNSSEEDNDDVGPVETYIDYDSEENEIEVKMGKNERLLKAADFFDKEAELSDSEWGSADEDEKGTDTYDIELGDEDEFDKQQIQTELGKIHLRKILDEDKREIKKIQDMLFEDEENDGIGRQRQFKWRNLDNSFNLEVQDINDENHAESEDEDNEETWRKMRHERDLLLKEGVEKGFNDLSSLERSTVKKIVTLKSKFSSATISDNESSFLISKGTTSAVRGSFLVRDKETLAKLASLTKTGTDSEGVISTAQVNGGKARNFVFTTVSEMEKTTLKRKSSNSQDVIQDQSKRPKFTSEIRSKKHLIDFIDLV